MFKDLPEGETHYFNDGCGNLAHNQPTTAKEIERILKEEDEKLKKAKELLDRLESYWFSILDPRYWRTSKELSKVVHSFRWGKIK